MTSSPEPAASGDPGCARPEPSRTPALVLAALGVVFGDISTSPLYAMKECFGPDYGLELNEGNLLGIASLIVWSLILVVALKYVTFILRADNKGEGGILALLALANRAAQGRPRLLMITTTLGLLGAALFYGDAMVTPAISVLSAVEGLEVVAPALHEWIVPLTLVILVGLFAIQARGTALVGRLFGPVMAAWFGVLAALGAAQIVTDPGVLRALDPSWAAAFAMENGVAAFLVLGAVVLAVTGGEALYADMGHFGRRPIRVGWFAIVLPALVLQYLGQTALLLQEPDAVRNPFYLMAPELLRAPLIALATLATVIASQAVISGAFSLTRQAIQLGFCPRLEIRHTSEEEEGQIYIARINWALLFAVTGLVIGFGSSSALAAAYGIAVTGTMLIDGLLALVVARLIWRWPAALVALIGVAMIALDGAFFGATLHKVPDGGWAPLVIGLLLFLLMTTWRDGRRVLARRLAEGALPLRPFLESESWRKLQRVPGTAVFMTGATDVVPLALLHNLKHNKVAHERVVFLTVQSEDVPRVAARNRAEIEELAPQAFRLRLRYGFMQEPNIPNALRLLKATGVEFDLMQTSFFLGRETLIPSISPGMSEWRERLFILMSRNAMSATDFFRIPANRVIELGAQVHL